MDILNFIRGFCMALADSVPGVSGGTIAFILGFYDEFVDSLNNLISGDKLDRKKAFKFLFKIGIGWIVGFILSALFIASIFEKNIYEINSLFLGLIIASIPLIIKSEKNTLLKNKRKILFLIIGIFVVYLMTCLNPMIDNYSNFSIKVEDLSIGITIYIFIIGMVAISAMVLPGISGSTILLIFGLYIPILDAINKVIKLKFEYLPSIIIFGCGVLIGILVTVRIVRYLLRIFRAEMIYCIIGLMIGSIYTIVIGPKSIEASNSPINLSTFNVVFFSIGCILVPLLEKIKETLDNK